MCEAPSSSHVANGPSDDRLRQLIAECKMETPKARDGACKRGRHEGFYEPVFSSSPRGLQNGSFSDEMPGLCCTRKVPASATSLGMAVGGESNVAILI